jgi:phosphate transport system substrate-binding protein
MKLINLYQGLLAITLVACASDSDDISPNDEVVRIKGSDTEFMMVQDLAKQHSEITGVEYAVSGEGTSTGINGLIDKSAHVANCSRPIYLEEVDEAKSNGVDPVPAIIAIDAIALISNPKNKVDSLSTIELQAIFSGDIDNWSQVGGLDRPINFYGRNPNSGTYRFLEDRFVRYEGFSYKMHEMESNQDILDAVMTDTFAIGYVGAGFLMDENGKPNPDIWAMYLYAEGDQIAYSPYESSAVINGDYPLVRPLYQYFNGIPEGKIADFLKFELSDEGQEIIRSHGFFPITSEYESENRSNGINF